MTPGSYRTAAGSTVRVVNGRSLVEFDWLEEGGCIECEPCVDMASQELWWA